MVYVKNIVFKNYQGIVSFFTSGVRNNLGILAEEEDEEDMIGRTDDDEVSGKCVNLAI